MVRSCIYIPVGSQRWPMGGGARYRSRTRSGTLAAGP